MCASTPRILIGLVLMRHGRASPTLTVRLAKQKRKETGDNRYWAPLERNSLSGKEKAKQIIARPFQVLIHEPMLIAITIYMSVREPA